MKRYRFHRLAMVPLLPGAARALPETGYAKLMASDGRRARQWWRFLHEQGLLLLWKDYLERNPPIFALHPRFLECARRAYQHASGQLMIQRVALEELRAVFERQEIPHLLFKGAHTRELLYPDPAMRTAGDLDVLVSRLDRKRAIDALLACGYRPCSGKQNISHEVALSRDGVCIDLHWDIMRPGRTRQPLTERILDSRVDYGSHWGPNKDAMFFLLLVHPVITKYVTTPHATLVRVLDAFLWAYKQGVDWPQLGDWLERAGLRTAGWISLEWMNMLGAFRAPGWFDRFISPGRWRQSYFRHWLAYDYSSRFGQRALIVHPGFSLLAHDRPGDAWRAMKLQRRFRATAEQEYAYLFPVADGKQ